MLPTSMRRAVSLMYVGAVVAIVKGIADGLTTHNVEIFTYSSTSANAATVHYSSSLIAGIFEGIVVGGLWLWMAWKTGAGRNWARVLSSVFFGFACLQLIGGISSLRGSGDTVPAFIALLIEWGVGLAVIIQLWQRESGEFFAFAKQAKPAGAHGHPPRHGQSGYEPPDYRQPPR
jgi:hypothetical protein